MKKFTTVLGILMIIASTLFAQAPQSFKYQAIARDAEGNILSNQNISLRISIVSGNVTSVAVYTETHNLRTSPFGLINLEIGNGENKSGDFSKIDWSKGKYYVNIEIDENGGNDFVSIGSSQLLSVPYALYSEESGSSSSTKEANSWTEGTGVTYLTNPNNVGIGTTVPVSKLHVTGTAINAVYERNISTAAGPANRFYKSRGSESSKTQVQTGDNLGQFQFWGMGDDGSFDIGATIKGVAESTRSGADIFDVSASIQFLTTNTDFNWGERMRITADGDVGIGTSAPAGILDIAGAYHFPSVDGTSGQVLKTNGSGILSWTNESIGATNINGLSDGKTNGTSVYLGSGAGVNDGGTSNYNVAVGVNALNNNTSNGLSNTAIGHNALFSNTMGQENTAVGNRALYSNLTGQYNSAVGMEALYSNTSGYYNTGIGYWSLFSNTTGQNNTSMGFGASQYNSTGGHNTTIGFSANHFNQGGSYNTIIGSWAGASTSLHSKSGCVFIGYQVGYYETANNKLYIDNSNTPNPLIYGDFSTNLLRVNGTLNVNNAYQFPTADGSNGQVLITNGGGVVSWGSAGTGSINDLSDAIYDGSSLFLGAGSGLNDDGSDNRNVGVGYNALKDNYTGQYNTAMGFQALVLNVSGNNNVALGAYTLNSATSGDNNIAIGFNTLDASSVGNNNIAIGASALTTSTTGEHNIAIGISANQNNSTGHHNVTLGSGAMVTNTTGHSNAALGYNALHYNTTGNYNVGLGRETNYNNETGSNNTIIGYQAGHGTSVHNKSGCVFIGYQAGYNEHLSNKLYIDNSGSSTPLIYGDFSSDLLRVYGTFNINNQYSFPTIDGSNGQVLKTNGSGTLSWGAGGASQINDLSDGKTTNNSTFLGYDAGFYDNGGNYFNVAVGYEAHRNNVSGYCNTATGYRALYSNLSNFNTAFGYSTLSNNSTGNNNTAVGAAALQTNSTGNNNTAVGEEALYSNTTGNYNTTVGFQTMPYSTTGGSNTALGNRAMFSNTDGYNNTSTGLEALYSNTNGTNNVANGTWALYKNTSGSYNVGLGSGANYYNQTGISNTIIGFEAGRGTSNHDKSGCVLIGYQAGYNDHGSNKLYIESSNSTTPLIYGEFDNDILTFNGRVGIGTLCPSSSKLHVEHNNLFAGHFTSSYANSNTKVLYAEYNNTASVDAVAVYGKVTPNANTNFGIGGQFLGNYIGVDAYSNPGTSNFHAYGVYALCEGTSGYRFGVYGKANGGTYRYGVYGEASTIPSNSYAFYCNGNGVYSGTWTSTSDKKFKKNIQPVENALDKVMLLDAKTYDFRTEEYDYINLAQGKHFGFIAQDMENVIPEVVSTVSHPKSQGKESEVEKFKGINYIELVPILTQAIKEQQAIIDDLKNEIEALKKEVYKP